MLFEIFPDLQYIVIVLAHLRITEKWTIDLKSSISDKLGIGGAIPLQKWYRLLQFPFFQLIVSFIYVMI